MNLLHILLSILLVLGILYVYVGHTEGFTLKPAEFPREINNTLLMDSYSSNNNTNIGSNTNKDNSKMKLYTNMSSYEQKTNNIMGWETPDNGTCSPAEFCGSLYNKKMLNNIKKNAPKDSDGVRIGYFTQ